MKEEGFLSTFHSFDNFKEFQKIMKCQDIPWNSYLCFFFFFPRRDPKTHFRLHFSISSPSLTDATIDKLGFWWLEYSYLAINLYENSLCITWCNVGHKGQYNREIFLSDQILQFVSTFFFFHCFSELYTS